MSSGFTYTFSAIRGVQAKREYYVSMCPLRLIPKIFSFEDADMPPEVRAQRVINRSRVPQITDYIVENPGDYTFSAITASIDGDLRFEPVGSGPEQFRMGTLSISMDARFADDVAHVLINEAMEALAGTVRHMANRLPWVRFAMSLCQLKGGRVFSMANRKPRVALVVTIMPPDNPPIVLLDVDRTGDVALSMVALHFHRYSSFDVVEASVKRALDGLVDGSGHWDHEIERELTDICGCERLPKMLTPRSDANARRRSCPTRQVQEACNMRMQALARHPTQADLSRRPQPTKWTCPQRVTAPLGQVSARAWMQVRPTPAGFPLTSMSQALSATPR